MIASFTIEPGAFGLHDGISGNERRDRMADLLLFWCDFGLLIEPASDGFVKWLGEIEADQCGLTQNELKTMRDELKVARDNLKTPIDTNTLLVQRTHPILRINKIAKKDPKSQLFDWERLAATNDRFADCAEIFGLAILEPGHWRRLRRESEGEVQQVECSLWHSIRDSELYETMDNNRDFTVHGRLDDIWDCYINPLAENSSNIAVVDPYCLRKGYEHSIVNLVQYISNGNGKSCYLTIYCLFVDSDANSGVICEQVDKVKKGIEMLSGKRRRMDIEIITFTQSWNKDNDRIVHDRWLRFDHNILEAKDRGVQTLFQSKENVSDHVLAYHTTPIRLGKRWLNSGSRMGNSDEHPLSHLSKEERMWSAPEGNGKRSFRFKI